MSSTILSFCNIGVKNEFSGQVSLRRQFHLTQESWWLWAPEAHTSHLRSWERPAFFLRCWAYPVTDGPSSHKKTMRHQTHGDLPGCESTTLTMSLISEKRRTLREIRHLFCCSCCPGPGNAASKKTKPWPCPRGRRVYMLLQTHRGAEAHQKTTLNGMKARTRREERIWK